MSNTIEDPRLKVIQIIKEYYKTLDPELTEEEAVEMATFQHDLVYQAMQMAFPEPVEKNPRGKVGKHPTDWDKPIIDASNASQVDLMGGPKGIHR